MNIQLTPKYAIQSDSSNPYILCQTKTYKGGDNAGKTYQVPTKFFQDLDGLVRYLINAELAQEHIETLQDLKLVFNSVTSQMIQQIIATNHNTQG